MEKEIPDLIFNVAGLEDGAFCQSREERLRVRAYEQRRVPEVVHKGELEAGAQSNTLRTKRARHDAGSFVRLSDALVPLVQDGGTS